MSAVKRRKPAPSTAQAFEMKSPSRSVQQPAQNAFMFEVENVHRVDGKRSFVAAFDVVMPGVRILDCRLHVWKHRASIGGPGRPASWLPERWKTLVEFDEDLAAEVLEVVEARLKVLAFDGDGDGEDEYDRAHEAR